jgi:hypothetical protein
MELETSHSRRPGERLRSVLNDCGHNRAGSLHLYTLMLDEIPIECSRVETTNFLSVVDIKIFP